MCACLRKCGCMSRDTIGCLNRSTIKPPQIVEETKGSPPQDTILKTRNVLRERCDARRKRVCTQCESKASSRPICQNQENHVQGPSVRKEKCFQMIRCWNISFVAIILSTEEHTRRQLCCAEDRKQRERRSAPRSLHNNGPI